MLATVCVCVYVAVTHAHRGDIKCVYTRSSWGPAPLSAEVRVGVLDLV